MLLSELADSAGLQRQAQRLIDAIDPHDLTGLVAASPQAERIVGAVDVLSAGRVSMWSPGSTQTVVICDVMLASGESIRRVARRVRRQGAEEVRAVVISDPWHGGQGRIPEVDKLIVLEPNGEMAKAPSGLTIPLDLGAA
jgi:hypothetical protein